MKPTQWHQRREPEVQEMSSLFIIVATFVCGSSLVAAVALSWKGAGDSEVEKRLKSLAAWGLNPGSSEGSQQGILAKPLDQSTGKVGELAGRLMNLQPCLDQAGMKVSPQRIILIMLGAGFFGGLVMAFLSPVQVMVPIFGLVCGTLPLGYVLFRRRRRMKKFSAQLPETLELISRALRAGHSLTAGIQLVAEQMPEPIGPEFARSYEEQKLGISLEEALQQMTQRVPNVDLRFFVTAIILQRTTGGNLSEILEKIGRLIRERFQIFGQIQALTGEGRLSGIVLLALPPVLFLAMLRLNYDYVMMLFEDPLGQKMLAGAIVMQLLGAYVIKKIIDIRV